MKLFYTLVCLIPTTIFAQLPRMDAQGFVTDAVSVRFSEASTLQLRDGQLYVSGQLLETTVSGYWSPIYPLPAEKLAELHRNAEQNLGKELPDPAKAFRFYLANAAERDKALAWLNTVPGVELARKVPVPVLAEAPDYAGDQLYIHTDDPGVHAETVWATYNNRGAGINICDVEYSFNANHTDLPVITLLGVDVAPEDPFQDNGNHGTAVFGEMGSLDNGVGTTGIATESEYFFAPTYIDQNYVFEYAMAVAADELNAGDVILIEQQMAGPNYTGVGQYGYVAMEWDPFYYEAIQLAVGNGIIVVEAAGNGSEDFDDPVYSEGNDGHYPFLAGNGSGAIIVGAGSAETIPGESRIKLWFSNYGSAVHIQGNGDHVTTTGYGDLFNLEGVDSEYTAGFGGTSGASPIVTASVALIQSVYEEETGDRLTSDQIRDLLIATGKPQVGNGTFPTSMHIGPLPNLDAALDLLMDHLDVSEAVNADLIVYPNPGNGTFAVQHKGTLSDPSAWTVTDISGKLVSYQLQNLGENLVEIQLTEAEAGVYFLHCDGNAQRIVVAD